GMPALMRAYRISERAAGVGFDWDTLDGVLAQTESEWEEFKNEINPSPDSADANQKKMELEFGDILFTMVNVARLSGIHPETALARATEKFIHRFKQMEAFAREQGIPLEKQPRDELEKLWVDAKQMEIPSQKGKTGP
ncbi:MAG: MazG nucleotide pyrophosphohydrolase domain-containing protein, partial [Desulfosarcinaceae bacterium]